MATNPSVAHDPFGILANKRDADLDQKGAFAPREVIPQNLLCPIGRPVTLLGLGYTKAVLALLSGTLQQFTYHTGATMMLGTATLASVGTTSGAAFTYDWHDVAYPSHNANTYRYGGFTYGATYQAAVMRFTQLWSQVYEQARLNGGSIDGSALYAAPGWATYIRDWVELLDRMNMKFPKPRLDVPWTSEQVKQATTYQPTRDTIVRMSSTLEVLTHQHPTDISRPNHIEVWVPSQATNYLQAAAADKLIHLANGASIFTLTNAGKLQVEGSPPVVPSTTPTTTSSSKPGKRPTFRGATPTPPPAAAPAAAAPAAAPTPTPPAPETPPPTPTVVAVPTPAPTLGPNIERIRWALDHGRMIMLVGPTATGKTYMAKKAIALSKRDGFELYVLTPTSDGKDAFGSYTRKPGTNEFVPIDGPITRWARRVIAGKNVVLILDEMARGHGSMMATILDLLNVYDVDDIKSMDIELPENGKADERYHIVHAWHTGERLLVPVSRSAILGTANLGEGYEGAGFKDRAFRRRWEGGWMHIPAFDDTTASAILSAKYDLPQNHPWIVAMLNTRREIEQYQMNTDALEGTLDFATLENWLKAMRRYVTLVRSDRELEAMWLMSARNLWMERICPLKGAELDPDIQRALNTIVNGHRPKYTR